MKKHKSQLGWFLTAWLVATVLAAAVLFSGCTYIDWQKYIAQGNQQVETVANKSPFSDTIGENLQLNDCQAAEKRVQFAITVHNNLIKIWHKLTDDEQKDVVEYQIGQLEDYVSQVRLWMSDNCSET